MKIKECNFFAKCVTIQIYLKFIEVQCNVIFLSCLVSEMREKESSIWENAYLSIKSPKASVALKQTSVLCHMLTLLKWCCFAVPAFYSENNFCLLFLNWIHYWGSSFPFTEQRLVKLSVSLRTQTILHCLIVQVLNPGVYFIDSWYTPFTSIHCHLEYWLAILT